MVDQAILDDAALEEMYARISAEGGIEVKALLETLDALFERDLAPETQRSFAERVGRYKKLADEVVPIGDFLRATGRVGGRIRFPLDSAPYDAWHESAETGEMTGIEATLSLARGRVFLAKYRQGKKVSPGFLGVSDASKKDVFAKATARPRTLHARGGIEKAVVAGVRACLENKNEDCYKGGILLISAELMAMPGADWDAILDDIRPEAKALPFDEVHVIDDRFDTPVVIRLK